MHPHRVRIAVVGGGGGIGWGSHLPAIAALPQAELVAVCDTDEEGLARAVAQYGGVGYRDLDTLLEREDVDLVDLASPDFLHAEQTMRAARAGKHVLCEKPMALSLEDARAMQAAAQAAGVKFMVAQSMRWLPECRAFKEACGRIGRPVYAAHHIKGRFFPYPEGSFYRTAKSLGQFMHNGMHWMDLISWCLDSLPMSVYARSARHYPTPDRLETDNYLAANVTYASGASAVFEMNLLMLDPPGFPAEQWWYVVGTEGTAQWAVSSSRCTSVFNPQGLSFPRKTAHGTTEDPFRGEIGHLCDCILRDEPPAVPMDWSIGILAACLGVVDSARTGEVVEVGNDNGVSPPGRGTTG